MARIAQDPNVAEPPDFDSQDFRDTCTPLATVERTVDHIINDLKATWTRLNDAKKVAWQLQTEADQEAENEALKIQQEFDQAVALEQQRLEETERREKDKKKPKIKDFTADKPVGNVVTLRPSSYALAKLRDFEYIELHYFSTEGCTEAAKHDLTSVKDTFALMSSNNRLLLKPMAALKPSSKVLRDEDLNWRQMTMAKNNMLHHMGEEGWPNKHVALATFFLRLDCHRLRQQPDSDAVLIIYQAQVRREWHDALKTTNDKEGFDIGIINDQRIDALHTMLLNTRQALAVTRYVPMPEIIPSTVLTPSPFCSYHPLGTLVAMLSSHASHLLHQHHIIHVSLAYMPAAAHPASFFA
jgi:hypothetical protein